MSFLFTKTSNKNHSEWFYFRSLILCHSVHSSRCDSLEKSLIQVIIKNSPYVKSGNPMPGMQMVGQMVMPLINEIEPMVNSQLMDHNEMSQVYMTTEGDDCSAPPAEDQMMGCLDAMKMACKDVSKFNWIISLFSQCSCLRPPKIHRLLLATPFTCAPIPTRWACIASPQCQDPATCNSGPQEAWLTSCWTWWVCVSLICKAWWWRFVPRQHFFDNLNIIVFYIEAWNWTDVLHLVILTIY